MTVDDVRLSVLAELRARDIPYEMIEHEPADTMEKCALCEARLGGVMPKNLFLTPRSRHVHCLLVMRPELPFHTSVVSKRAGTARLGFAPEEDLFAFLRTRPGSISPLGLMFDREQRVRLMMDEALQTQERVLVHPCDNRYTLALARADQARLFSAWGRAVEWINLDEGKE